MDEFKNVTIFIVCLLAGAMLAVGAWRLLSGLSHAKYTTQEKHWWVMPITCFIAGIVLLGFGRATNRKMKTDRWEKAITDGYVFYIDGQEIDPQNINMNKYQVTYDDETKKVMLNPDINRITFIPIFMR